jgi:hypothetical protein
MSFNFSAEAQCFEQLGWEQPRWPIDPYVEHVAKLNGVTARDVFEPGEDDEKLRFRLIDALRFHGIEVSAEGEAHKEAMQLRSAQGEPFTANERRAITDYCSEDVHLLGRLFLAMRDKIDLPAALVRARYVIAIGQQMHRGIPVDRRLVERFTTLRPQLRLDLINETPGASQIYISGHFKRTSFLAWAETEEIGWPCNSEIPDLDRDTFTRVAQLEPRVAPLATLISKLSKLEETVLKVRSDDRIRPNFLPFRTRTGRNAARARDYLMLQPKWVRGFILAQPGRALAQIDFKAQEVYIAAALSGDRQLLHDLETDPYLVLAARCGFAPQGATKKTHGAVRDLFKIVFLGIGYGMGERTLAAKLKTDLVRAREVRTEYKRRYRTLWEWFESVVMTAYTTRYLESPLGWPLMVGPDLDSFTLRNHLIQATGGDVLRAACLHAQDAGLNTIATLHDSILLEVGANQAEVEAAELAVRMTRGAQDVIGIPIPAEVEFINQRYQLKEQAADLYREIIGRLELIK